ncbi:MAG: hypothetical protein KGL19_15895 [Bacteroidota bacterium]|nr:hypothetical protein [Bacteroidota bacterium]
MQVSTKIRSDKFCLSFGLIILLLFAFSLCHGQNNRITVVTIAGTGEEGCKNGMAKKATFKYPQGIAVDDSGNVYIGDLGNQKIRKITPTGIVSTYAGNGESKYKDGILLEAGFYGPNALVFDKKGNLYVDDIQKIRKITPDGHVSTFAGSGDMFSFKDGKGTDATFWNSCGIASDANSNIYVADYGNQLIRKISYAGIVNTFAAALGEKIDVYSKKRPPHFDFPSGVAVDSKGNVYVSEAYNNKILKVTPAGIVTTFAGNGNQDSTDGKGNKAGFNWPQGLAMDSKDNLFVADAGNNKIRMITPDGIVTTLAGNGDYASDDGDAASASFYQPKAIAVDKHGAVYVAELESNKIRKITFDYNEYLKNRLEGLKANDHHEIIDTTSIINQIDTLFYKGIPYWNSKMKPFGPSYIDTFTESDIKFRIVHINNTRKRINTATLERLTNGKWLKRIEFEPLNHEGDFYRNQDVNRDGFNDIIHELRFNSEVYFFNYSKKDFIDSATAEINDDIFLIDTAKNIFCDFQEYKGMCGQITSSLYTFKGLRKYQLFELEFYNCKDPDLITKIILKKSINGSSELFKKVKDLVLKKPFGTYDVDKSFNYKAYWKKEYKKLLDYQ